MPVPISHIVYLSLALFSIGLIGVLTRRDAITVFLSVEIMLNAANVAFVGFSRALGDSWGQFAVFIVIAVAAAEAALGLTIVIRLHEKAGTLDLSKIRRLRG